jgi:hypothetical protein
MKKFSFATLIIFVLSTALVFTGCGSKPTTTPESQEPEIESAFEDTEYTLRVGTTSVGGTYNLVATAWTQSISKQYSNLIFDVQVTGGAVGNLQLFANGELDLPLSLAMTMVEAREGGTDSFPDPVYVEALTAMFPGALHIVASTNSGITSLEDIKGKSVSIGEIGHSTIDVTSALFEAMGIDIEKDIKASRLNLMDSVDALSDGRIDVMIYQGGITVPPIVEATTTTGKGVLLSVSDELIEKTNQINPAIAKVTIPAGSYDNEEDMNTVGAWNFVLCDPSMDEELVYHIVKGIWDNHDEWRDNVGCLRTLTPELACSNCPVDFHPGAIRYFKEIGAWKN